MANVAMIDIETFDTRPSAVVFQVGVVIFQDPVSDSNWTILEKKIYHLDVVEQIIAGRTVDQDAQLFWAKQEHEAWDRGSDITVRFRAMIEDVARLISHWGVGDVWSNSPSFDAVILRSAHEDMNAISGVDIAFPFNFRQDMDLRTLKQLIRRMGRLDKYKEPEKTTHNALQDAQDQTFLLGFMLREFAEMHEVVGRYEIGEISEYHPPNPDPLPGG